jgi:CubicO group peptidase (beta-lactamase class C family)
MASRPSLVLLLAFACADPETTLLDGGADADTGTPVDAGQPDATPEDASAPDTGEEPIPERFAELAQSFEAERIALGAPGAAIAVIEGGEVSFARGFGSKHPNENDPVRATTLFRIGSVTKVLTAIVVLQLVAEGRISLDDPLTEALPGFAFAQDPSWAPSITVRHLLTHASGMVDYAVAEVPPDQQLDSALESYLYGEFAEIAYLMAPAGRMWNYSNPNFYVAGLVAEKERGEPYRSLMRERLFAPLGMDRTFFLPSEALEDGDFAFAASRNMAGNPIVVAPDDYDNAWARPAGFAFSSVLDLAKLVAFIDRGDESVLPAAEWEALASPQIDTKNFFDLEHYGYGLIVSDGAFFGGPNEFRRLRIITHGGAIQGHSAEIWWLPSLDLGLVTLASTDGAYFRDALITAIRTLVTLPPADPPPVFTPDPSVYAEKYAGTYRDDFNVGTVVVSTSAASLLVSMPDLDRFGVPYEPELVHFGPDNFLLSVQGFNLPLTFILDDDGRAEFLRTRPFVAKRVMTLRHQAARAFRKEAFMRAVRDEARRRRVLFDPR